MNTRDKIRQIKQDLADRFFPSGCDVCNVKKHKMGMAFHHKVYRFKGDHRQNYKKGVRGDLEYFVYLSKRVETRPEDFNYLCTKHHQAVTKLGHYKKETLQKILKIVVTSS